MNKNIKELQSLIRTNLCHMNNILFPPGNKRRLLIKEKIKLLQMKYSII